jgi:hypothetical protein
MDSSQTQRNKTKELRLCYFTQTQTPKQIQEIQKNKNIHNFIMGPKLYKKFQR